MNKYVNGKLLEMTEEDKAALKARFDKIRKPKSDISEYEKRIEELEAKLAELLNKTPESEE